MILRARLDQAIQHLAEIDSAVRDARLILAHVHGVDVGRLGVMLGEDAPWGAAQENYFFDCLDDRARGRPVAKIIGRKAFWKSDFWVNDDVLDPRPDTETLVEAALTHPFDTLLDLGTGSGCILISLLLERQNARGLGVDISAPALTVAQENAQRLGVGDRATFAQSNMFTAVGHKSFDLIVSNPPYIALDEMAKLPRDTLFDPRIALTDEADGLAYYRQIAAQAHKYLTPLGAVMVEIGPTQAAQVADLFAACGFVSVQILTDLDGRDRVICARL